MHFLKRTFSFPRTDSGTAKSSPFPRTFEATSEGSEEINSSNSMDPIDQSSAREILRNGLDPDDPKVKLPETAEPKYESDFIKAERRRKEQRRRIKIKLGIVELGPISFLESIKSDPISSVKLQSEMMQNEIEPNIDDSMRHLIFDHISSAQSEMLEENEPNYGDPMESPIDAPELRRGISQEEQLKNMRRGFCEDPVKVPPLNR